MSFLADILARKHVEVVTHRAAWPEPALRELVSRLPPARDFAGALSARGGPTCVVAEVKRRSPSVGAIDPALDAPTQARRYAEAGAAAISVLTDGPGFGGSLADLEAVRAAVGLPLLRKDFVISAYQLLEARAHGADAALLIVAALGPVLLGELLAEARRLGLGALVEVHDELELSTALDCGATVVGINNRDLATFHVDLAVSERLLPRLPAGVKGVAESGVRTPADAARLKRAGAANLLVGEALVRAPDAGALLRSLVGAA